MDKSKVFAASASLLYAFSSAGETLAVKALNYAPNPLYLPAYTALLSNQMWIFMVPVYLLMPGVKETPRHTTLIYALHYTGFGILTFVITILRNISVNAIPGSVFTLLISTSILFNILLSWIVLKKKFNYWHIGAALTCLASALSIGITALFTNQEGTYNFPLGISTGIAGAAAIAAMNVAQEYIQPKWDNLHLRLVEMTLVSSLIASLLVALFGLSTGEVAQWSVALSKATITKEGLILVASVSITLPILKLLVRNSKYSIIQFTSAFFFEFIQATAALLGSMANVFIFDEQWGLGYVAALILLALSFGMYSKAKLLAKSVTKSVTSKSIVIENPIPQTILVVVNVWK